MSMIKNSQAWAFLYEIPLLYLALFLFDHYFIAPTLSSLLAYPILILIGFFLTIPRYSSLSILYSAACAFVTVFLKNDTSLTSEDFALLFIFILFSSLWFYRFKFKFDHQKENQDQTLKFQQEFNQSLKQEIENLKIINEELENRAVSPMNTLITAYESLKKLESLNLEELYTQSLEVLQKIISAKGLAFYIKKNNEWHLKESIDCSNELSPIYLNNQALVGLSGSTERVISIRDFLLQNSKTLTEEVPTGILAGPIRKGENPEVIGVILIESMEFTKFNSANILLFNLILNWISRAFGRALYIYSLQDGEILDPELGIYSFSYFKSRTEQEFERSKTYYLPLSVLFVHFKENQILKGKAKKRFILLMCEFLKIHLKKGEVIAQNPNESLPLLALLITTTQKQANETCNKLQTELKIFLENHPDLAPLSSTLSFTTKSFEPKMKQWEEMIA